jgi:CRISPR-associated protein Csx14
MKTAVIATLGMSPPVVTSGIDRISQQITDLVLITTKDKTVQAGAELIRIALAERYPRIHLHNEIFPLDDISTTQENFSFMSRAAHIIKNQREVHHCDQVFLNVAGGRKNMCITLALLGQLMSVDGVYHIVNTNISMMNEQLEFLRHDIEMIVDAKSEDDKIACYHRSKDEFTHLLFPPAADYEIIRIPTLPYPEPYLVNLIQGIKTDIDSLSKSEQITLGRHGILEKGKSRYYLSDYGREFIEVLLG